MSGVFSSWETVASRSQLEPVALLELADQGLADQAGLLGSGRLGPLGRRPGPGPFPVGPDRALAGQVDGHGGDEDRDQTEAGLGDHGDHRRHPQRMADTRPQAHPWRTRPSAGVPLASASRRTQRR